MWKEGVFQKVLTPGIYTFWDPLRRLTFETYDLTMPVFEHKQADFLLQSNADKLAEALAVVDLAEFQVGLLYTNGKFTGVLAPNKRYIFWKGAIAIRVETIDISTDFQIRQPVAGWLAHADSLPRSVSANILVGEVADHHLGLLVVDGTLVETLKPGLYAYWKFHRNVRVDTVDMRLLTMEVSGQEILTKDKVSLRVNLSAAYQMLDPVKTRRKLAKPQEFIYRELQFALRQIIGTRALDSLLADKHALDREVHETVAAKLQAHGMVLHAVGVKDIILPGDMKEILNQVVETEKAAQANVIKRREETAATRSLLNTARLMDENPTLMRLKELEVLEKITEKVDKLTVFGGLDSVLNDTIKIQVKAD